MEVLASRIALDLKASNHCAVYEEELARIWPITDKDRETKIKSFAREQGLQVAFYKSGLCAIFIKASQSALRFSEAVIARNTAGAPARDESTEAVRNIEKATESKPVRGETLLRSRKLKRQPRAAKKRIHRSLK